MRKQTKKVLSWVLAGAMTLGLTANVNFAPASADDATAFTAKLSAQMDVTKSDVAEWDFSAEGTGKLGELSTVTYDSDKKACFSGNFIGIDTDLTYVEGQTAKIYSIKADGKELENVDLSKIVYGTENDKKTTGRITIRNAWGDVPGIFADDYTYEAFNKLEITYAIGDATHSLPDATSTNAPTTAPTTAPTAAPTATPTVDPNLHGETLTWNGTANIYQYGDDTFETETTTVSDGLTVQEDGSNACVITVKYDSSKYKQPVLQLITSAYTGDPSKDTTFRITESSWKKTAPLYGRTADSTYFTVAEGNQFGDQSGFKDEDGNSVDGADATSVLFTEFSADIAGLGDEIYICGHNRTITKIVICEAEDVPSPTNTPAPTVQPSDNPNVTPGPTNKPTNTPAPTKAPKAPKKGAKVESGKVVYKVTKAATAKKAGTLSLVGLSKAGKKATKLSSPATAKINGYNYKVTSIGKNAFKGANAKTISLSKNIKSIPAGAFANCKKLSTLKVKAKLTKVTKKAFKGCKKTIKVKGASKKITKANVKKLKKSGYKKFK